MTISRAEQTERLHDFSSDRSVSADPAARTTRPDLPAARRSRISDDVTSARHERLPTSSDHLAFLAQTRVIAQTTASASVAAVATDATRDAAVQAKLDAVRDAFSGPYVVDGAQVTARPMFRMYHARPPAMVAQVDALGARAGVRAPMATRMGQGTPSELVKITQALIDAGHLPSGPGDVATRIRKMQWDYGIGVDCAGYSKQALAACSARPPFMHPPGMESFRDLDGARANRFARLPIESARPGDLMTLDPIAPEIYGHNVVVYSHVTADAAKVAELAAQHGPVARAFLSSAGPHHVLEVDSSWGAGAEGGAYGGFRRDTWIYDASSKIWGYFDPHSTPARFMTSPRGPSGDAYHATYRPR